MKEIEDDTNRWKDIPCSWIGRISIVKMTISLTAIHKYLTQLNIKTTINPIKKWAGDLNRHFYQEDIQMGTWPMKSCSALLVVKEMHIKITVRYHLIPDRMAIIKSLQIVNAGEAVEVRESFYTVTGNVNWCSHFGEQYRGFLKIKHNHHMTQQSYFWAYIWPR